MDVDFVIGLLALGEPEPPSDPAGALEALRFHGLQGLAVARDREVGGTLLGPGLRAELEPAYRSVALATTLTLESAERARAALRGAGIDALLFKGAALVRDGVYSDPGARRMDDADVLVRRADAPRAVEVLCGTGFRPVTGWEPERMAWVDAVTLHDQAAEAGVAPVVDLHWATDYDRIRFGSPRESPLWQDADPAAGSAAPETHLVVSAEHLLKHLRYKVHLAAYADLARLAARVERWDRVARASGTSRLARGLAALWSILGEDLGAPIPPGFAPRVRRSLVEALRPRWHVGAVRPVEGRLGGLRLRWRLIGSWTGVAADVAEALLPPPAWLRARYHLPTLLGWPRYWADLALWAAYRGRSPASPNQELFAPTARE